MFMNSQWDVRSAKHRPHPPLPDDISSLYDGWKLSIFLEVSPPFEEGFNNRAPLAFTRWLETLDGSTTFEVTLDWLNEADISSFLDGYHTRFILESYDARWEEFDELSSETFSRGTRQAIEHFQDTLTHVEKLNGWITITSPDITPKTYEVIKRLRLWKYQELFFIRQELFVRFHKKVRQAYSTYHATALLWQRYWRKFRDVVELIQDCDELSIRFQIR
jgi:hypothetical protein